MSDSEYENSFPLCAPPPQKKPKKQRASATTPAPSSKKARAHELFGSDSDSEPDSPQDPRATSVTASLPKKPPPKPKTKQSSSGKKKPAIFQILQAEEKAAVKKEDKKVLWSSFTTRVASGRQRRAAILGDGAFFVDLKVYNADDAIKGARRLYIKKALVAVKLQAAEGSVPWEKLQVFLEDAYGVFKDCEPVVYKDYNNSLI